MIKYKLECKDCEIIFDSWFASSKEYEKLKKKNFLTCYSCNSQNVKKTIKDYQKFIKENFEYVGKNFAYEARSIHYERKTNKKSIYGNASKKDLKELKEEGIETQMIPWVEDKDN